jgi:hypothetical protein
VRRPPDTGFQKHNTSNAIASQLTRRI